MSALGGLPGFAFPSLDYGATELLSESAPSATVTVATTFFYTFLEAGDGNALFIRSVFCNLLPSAAVANRSTDVILLDATGHIITEWRQPLTATAGVPVGLTWDVSLATAYIVQDQSYSPLTSVILPPGGGVRFVVVGAQIGDQIVNVFANGIKIPTSSSPVRDAPAVAPVLLT